MEFEVFLKQFSTTAFCIKILWTCPSQKITFCCSVSPLLKSMVMQLLKYSINVGSCQKWCRDLPSLLPTTTPSPREASSWIHSLIYLVHARWPLRVGTKKTVVMNSWEGHGCPDLLWGSYHIVKAWKNGRGGFSSYCPVVEEKVSVKFILIEFCMHQCCSSGFFVLLWRVCGAGRTLHLLFPAALQSNTFRMHFFALKFFAAWLFTFWTVRNVLSSP